MHLNVKTKVPKQWLLSTLTVNTLLSQTPSSRHMGPALSIKYTTRNTQSPRGNKYSLLYSDLFFPPKTHSWRHVSLQEWTSISNTFLQHCTFVWLKRFSPGWSCRAEDFRRDGFMRRAWVDPTVKPGSVRSRGHRSFLAHTRKAEVSDSQPISSPTLRVFRIQLQVACMYLNPVPSVLARSPCSPSRPPCRWGTALSDLCCPPCWPCLEHKVRLETSRVPFCPS